MNNSILDSIINDPVFMGIWIVVIMLLGVLAIIVYRANRSLNRDILEHEHRVTNDILSSVAIANPSTTTQSIDKKKAHRSSFQNRQQIENSETCGCYYCCRQFDKYEIVEWVDQGQTATCPYCKVDSVIGDASEFPLNHAFLDSMRKQWFGRAFAMTAVDPDKLRPTIRNLYPRATTEEIDEVIAVLQKRCESMRQIVEVEVDNVPFEKNGQLTTFELMFGRRLWFFQNTLYVHVTLMENI